jgi:hypothetical protein
MASVAPSEIRGGTARRGELGPRLLGGAMTGSVPGAGRASVALAEGAPGGGFDLGWPGLSGAMPGRATPRTVFCADAIREPDGPAAPAGGAGGGDGYGASGAGGGEG